MKIRYLVEITEPKTHLVKVTLAAKKESSISKLKVFLPSWSPGSYLMREYGKDIRSFKVLNAKGEYLYFEQVAKSIWEIDWSKSDVKDGTDDEFTVEYEVYCHDLTCRTSHVDESHAFLHGPSFLMGILDQEMQNPEIEIKFPPLWSKLHTGMKDISTKRETFIYSAENYDDLIDCPIEIGCHDSDGFSFDGKDHHVIFYGKQYDHPYDLKKDMKTIVETVAGHFEDIPYEHYTFMTHLFKDKFGGLEHKNSTVLQYDGRKLKNRTDYINWLALVAHEYFHTWNVKRIRPIELGPFDYTTENYTRMHWLTEGLTSFMDEIFVFRSKLITLKEYLAMQIKNLNRYYAIPGKKFHSLEDSSFNAWIKLYRPDENSNNSSISYYLKGGLVFSTLHFDLLEVGKSLNDLLTALWSRFKANPGVGVTKDEVLSMIEEIGNKDIRDRFELRISTTEDIDFETYYNKRGMDFIWDDSVIPTLGIDFTFKNERVFVAKVIQDGPAYKAGINAGDEIIAINGQRFLQADTKDLNMILTVDKQYGFTVARLQNLMKLDVIVGKQPRVLKEIKVVDAELAEKSF